MPSASVLLLDLLRPLLHRLPRGAGTLYRRLGGHGPSPTWAKKGLRLARGKHHGLLMRLDLSNSFERETYYLGEFYEWELLGAIDRFVRPGDTFIDVGANIGMIALHAAARVGPEGTVLAFEPNPAAKTRLDEHVKINRLPQVRTFGVALGEQSGRATLSAPAGYSSQSTLRRTDKAIATFEVEIATLDSFLDWIPDGRSIFLKTDTEGYDFSVLKGARRLLARPQVTAFCEVNHQWLEELGQTAQQMFAYMAGLGFRPFFPKLERRSFRRNLRLEPLTLPGPHPWFNVLFLRDGTIT